MSVRLAAARIVAETRTAPAGVPAAETQERTAPARVWNVVVHNDPVNLMSYVTWVFQKIFRYPRAKAEQHMWEVHRLGRSILWSGELERAEGYVRELHAAQLLATIEQVG